MVVENGLNFKKSDSFPPCNKNLLNFRKSHGNNNSSVKRKKVIGNKKKMKIRNTIETLNRREKSRAENKNLLSKFGLE